ncbi:hypothetical protein ABE068_11365 [Bacillus glycinifermentans]|uniref:Uncharacterized protein n=1 Tax=Bacillus glycinifermentans TaxID=1664069 RepID=A0A0T6BRG3_9BACI|nr:hypothetical protein [Bacillus glycinifermentans]KRT94248.1 hypothetical protein AB447_202865 [Bacillus glycinifermentans]MEC0485766.1 hypothetical protein [Bacillus glycinifermentans]
MDTLDKLIKKQNDPMEKRRQLALLKTGMRGVAGTKLESVRNTLRPKFKVDNIQKEMNTVYSSLLYSFQGKAQQALAQRISQSAQQLIATEKDGESFVNGFKTR